MSTAPPLPLVGSWTVDRMLAADGRLRPCLESTRIEAHFDEHDSLAGSAGCNSFRGSFQTQGAAIAVGTVASTRKFCLRPAGVMEQEARFLELIARARRFSIDVALEFFDEAGTLILVLTRMAGDRG